MQLAVMQPYFLPYVGYFSLIAATDHFVVFDPVQYIRHGWINRNQILKPDFSTPQYIQVPLAKHSRQTLIRDIKISDSHDWKGKIFRQLQHYKRRAPFFEQASAILEKCLTLTTPSIVALNVHCLTTICEVLEIKFNVSSFDAIQPPIGPTQHPGQWALLISEALHATTYINPLGGRDIFQPVQFDEKGIELKFLENRLANYPQSNESFIPGLSIIDILMFNSLADTREQIFNYKTISAN